MLPIGRIKAALAAVAVSGATAAAVFLPASPAVAYSSGGMVLDLKVQSPGHLIAKGAEVSVPVEYTCFDANGLRYAWISVSLVERVSGGGLATGYGSTYDTSCTGEIQTTTITVGPLGARAFAVGSAVANGNIYGCDSTSCGLQPDSRTIEIRN